MVKITKRFKNLFITGTYNNLVFSPHNPRNEGYAVWLIDVTVIFNGELAIIKGKDIGCKNNKTKPVPYERSFYNNWRAEW